MTAARHLVVTGAGGFLGTKVAEAVLRDARFADFRITLTDLALGDEEHSERMRRVTGSLADTSVRKAVIDGRADVLIHLAGVLGGAAERDPELSKRVNLDASMALFEDVASKASPRIVFASSIAVFGPPLPALVDDDTEPRPLMVYGQHKRLVEQGLEALSGTGRVDGISIRLPGIVARRDADARLKSAFLNSVFFDYAAGRDIELPVSADGTSWLISVPTCVDAILHAATIAPSSLGAGRTFTLPAQRVRLEALVDALSRRFPGSGSNVRYRPDSELQAQFAAQPELRTPAADALGFRHDGSIDTLVERAMA